VFSIKHRFFLIRELLREVVMDITPTTPVAERGPAESGVLEATISDAPQRLGGAALGDILRKGFLTIFRRIEASGAQPRFCRVAPQSPLPAARGTGS